MLILTVCSVKTVTTTLLKCEIKTKLTYIYEKEEIKERNTHAKNPKNTQLKIRQRKINKIGMNSSNQ